MRSMLGTIILGFSLHAEDQWVVSWHRLTFWVFCQNRQEFGRARASRVAS
jgi:hypothetical protein